MSVEKMIDVAIQRVIANADQSVSAAEKRVKFLEAQTQKLAELYAKLIAAEDDDEIEELEDEAAELAEALDIEFIYIRADGRHRHYTPESFWEPSGGCEWVESAYYGTDYGWNI